MENPFDILDEVIDYSVVKSIKDLPKFKDNPFIKDFKYHKKKYYDKVNNVNITINNKLITDEDLKKHNLILAQKLYKDNEPFTKVFFNEITNIDKISPSGCKLFLHIIYTKLNINMDFIILNPQVLVTKLNMSIPSIYNAILDLCKEYILIKHIESNLYWINPHIIFRGDRKKIRFNN